MLKENNLFSNIKVRRKQFIETLPRSNITSCISNRRPDRWKPTPFKVYNTTFHTCETFSSL